MARGCLIDLHRGNNEKEKDNMTSDQIATLNDLACMAYTNATAKGFHDGDRVPLPISRIAEFVANLHGEASELWEAARKGKLGDLCDKGIPLTCAEEELADILIRCLDTAVALGVNIGKAVATKHAYNTTRPHKHGGKLA